MNILKSEKLNIALSIWIAFVFLQSLPFKFTGHEVTEHIFSTIGAWIGSLPVLSVFSGLFANYGAYITGTVELIASLLLLAAISTRFRKYRFGASVAAFVVIVGAIFFHVFTPLGLTVDGSFALFGMAVTVLVASTILIKNSK